MSGHDRRTSDGRSDEASRLRSALAQMPTGVAIVTAATTDGRSLGMTVNSFASVSLDPPLVLFCIDRRSLAFEGWQRAPGYAINVLAATQGPLSNAFARAGSSKWDGVEFERGLNGAPRIAGAIACFECSAHERFDGGDHAIFVARVERFTTHPTGQPLLFHRGRYGEIAGAPFAPAAAELMAWPLPIHY
jgi:flavin reductase (DIM6/NTAB) family NADH-FMN oxidoreductase RutF